VVCVCVCVRACVHACVCVCVYVCLCVCVECALDQIHCGLSVEHSSFLIFSRHMCVRVSLSLATPPLLHHSNHLLWLPPLPSCLSLRLSPARTAYRNAPMKMMRRPPTTLVEIQEFAVICERFDTQAPVIMMCAKKSTGFPGHGIWD